MEELIPGSEQARRVVLQSFMFTMIDGTSLDTREETLDLWLYPDTSE